MKRKLTPYLLLFAWPFICLWPYVTSFHNQYIRIGNDFQICYFRYKLYLLDYLSRMQIPLWSPSEAAGYPFYSNPFAQALYPLNIPLALYYKLNGGYQVLDHQRYTVLALSILSMGLYAWLRSLKFENRPALFSALLVGISFKATELLRFPNAIHTAAWFPWILFAVTKIHTAPVLKKKIGFAAALAFFTVCLLTGGYPYYAYYALFLFGPYLAFFLVPKIRTQWLGGDKPLLSSGVVAGGFLTGFLIASPYILAIKNLVNETVSRTGKSFEFSTSHVFNLTDTVGSLLYPPAAQFEGWYYIGITGLLLILLYLLSGKGGPKVLLLVWFVFISAVTYGRYSPLFVFFWKYLPFFANLQAWGRMNIILVPLIAWMLALAVKNFETDIRPNRLKVVLACFAVVLGLQLFFTWRGIEDEYWGQYFIEKFASGLSIPMDVLSSRLKATFLASTLGAGILLLIFLRRPAHRWALPALAVYASLEVLLIGPWVWCARRSELEPKENLNLAAAAKNSFDHPRTDLYTTVVHGSTYNVGTIWNWHFQRYVDFRNQHSIDGPEKLALEKLLGMSDGQKVFVTTAINQKGIQEFLNDADRLKASVQVNDYTGDVLRLEATLSSAGYVSFIDNWQEYWKAEVDGKEMPVEILFGTFKSVAVPAGTHQISFVYRPPFFARAETRP